MIAPESGYRRSPFRAKEGVFFLFFYFFDMCIVMTKYCKSFFIYLLSLRIDQTALLYKPFKQSSADRDIL
jgi:hypothetical protein